MSSACKFISSSLDIIVKIHHDHNQFNNGILHTRSDWFKNIFSQSLPPSTKKKVLNKCCFSFGNAVHYYIIPPKRQNNLRSAKTFLDYNATISVGIWVSFELVTSEMKFSQLHNDSLFPTTTNLTNMRYLSFGPESNDIF